MAVEIRRRRAAEGEADLVLQRRVEDADHQVRAAEHREVEVEIRLGDDEVLVVRIGGAVDAEVLVPAVGLEEARVLAVQRGDVEAPVGLLRHRPGERPDAADHVALRRLLHRQGELVEVETFVVVEEGLLADVVAAVVVVDPAGLRPAVDLDAMVAFEAVAEQAAEQRAAGIAAFGECQG
ncbi:hypothetical protein FQZ97_692450 [compost metagenome]